MNEKEINKRITHKRRNGKENNYINKNKNKNTKNGKY